MSYFLLCTIGSSGRVVERRGMTSVGDRGSKPPVVDRRTFRSWGQEFKTTSVSKLGQLRSPHFAFAFR